jgi:hypothetical protein
MNIFRVLLFTPSITFSLVPSEIFPWAILYFLIKKRIVLYKELIPLIVIFIISLLYSLCIITTTNVHSDIIRSMVAYFNAIIAYLAIVHCSQKEAHKIYKILEVLLFFSIILGILQVLHLINFLEPVFRLLKSRGSTRSIDASGRGVSLLTVEPSRAAVEFVFMYITWRYLKAMSCIKQLLFDFIILCFLVLVIRSSLGIFLFLVFLVCEYKFKSIAMGVIIGIIGFSQFKNINSRAIMVIYDILSRASIQDIFTYLLAASGQRLIIGIAAYKYGFFHLFGGGIGLWRLSSVQALYETNIAPSSVEFVNYYGGGSSYFAIRTTIFLPSLLLDIGWIASIIIICSLLKPLFKFFSFKHKLFPVMMAFVANLTILGEAPGNPLPWICIAICYRVYQEKTQQIGRYVCQI